MRKEKERCTQKQPRTVEWEAIATRGEFTHRFGLDLFWCYLNSFMLSFD